MTQEDALELAKLPAKTVKGLCDDGEVPDSFDVRSAAYRVEAERKVAAATKAAEDAGFTVIDESPDDWFQASFTSAGPDGTETTPESAVVTVNGKWGTLGHVDAKEHESEPCHVVFVRHDGTTIHGCSNHEAHPKPEPEPGDAGARESGGVWAREVEPSGPRPDQEAVESLMPTIKRALATGAAPEQVLGFVSVALFRDDDPWHTAEKAAQLLELSGTTDDPLEDLCVLSEDDAATALTAFAVQSYVGALAQVVFDVSMTGTPLDVMETSDDESMNRNVVDARRLLDFLRLVVPDDGIGTLEDIVADFATSEDDAQSDPTETAAAAARSSQATDAATPSAAPEVDDEDPTQGQSPSASDAEPDTSEPGDSAGAEDDAAGVTVTITKGGKPSAVKFFRDCSECGRISGFNTNKGDARRRGQEHLDEAHGGEGEVEAA